MFFNIFPLVIQLKIIYTSVDINCFIIIILKYGYHNTNDDELSYHL